jgi:3-deoxy-7-phosphoheptulonate synthase
MIVVMEPNAADEKIDNVARRVSELGLKAHVIRGTERTVIAAVGLPGGLRSPSDPGALQDGV